MKNVCITGASGYIGRKMAACLAEKDEVKQIVGIDIQHPVAKLPKFTFIRHDVREPADAILREYEIDTLIHTAFILPPLHDKGLMEDINVGGTRNILKSCKRAGVAHVLYTSSSTAYGFHPDNDNPLTEESPLRGNADFTYSKTKREIELAIDDWLKDGGRSDMQLTVIRPCFVVGPGFDNPLARHMRKKLCMLPHPSEALQFVHEDDLIRIMYLLLREKKGGIYNIGAEGTISCQEMVSKLGNMLIPLPLKLMYTLNHLAWYLRLTFLSEFPSQALNLIRYPWVVSSAKLERELGYNYQYTTSEAFDAFVRYVKGANQ
jgi:UDP-glucose 4-epimerase